MTRDQAAEICYECTGYGDDYYTDENGELISACADCWVNKQEELLKEAAE